MWWQVKKTKEKSGDKIIQTDTFGTVGSEQTVPSLFQGDLCEPTTTITKRAID